MDYVRPSRRRGRQPDPPSVEWIDAKIEKEADELLERMRESERGWLISWETEKEFKDNPIYWPHILRMKGLYLKYVPKDRRDEELCRLAVQSSDIALSHVPKEFLTEEMYHWAVSHSGYALDYVPPSLVTFDLCQLAFETNFGAIKFIPKEFQTIEMLITLVGKYFCSDLRHIDESIWNEELALTLIKQRPKIYEYVPDCCLTTEIWQIAVRYLLRIGYCSWRVHSLCVNDKYQSVRHFDDDLCKLLLENKHKLHDLPEENRTLELSIYAISRGLDKIGNVPYKLRTRVLLAVEQGYTVAEFWAVLDALTYVNLV